MVDISIDSTKGGENANSYISVEDADYWFATRFGYMEWFDIDEIDKKRLLMEATRNIDSIRCLYSKNDDDQALQYPVSNTSGDGEGDGFEEAQNACCYQAWHIYQNSDAMNEAYRDRLIGMSSKSYGSSSFTFSGFNQLSKYAKDVYRELSPFIDLSIKLVRA